MGAAVDDQRAVEPSAPAREDGPGLCCQSSATVGQIGQFEDEAVRGEPVPTSHRETVRGVGGVQDEAERDGAGVVRIVTQDREHRRPGGIAASVDSYGMLVDIE